jgi:Uma2 family endonuclease
MYLEAVVPTSFSVGYILIKSKPYFRSWLAMLTSSLEYHLPSTKDLPCSDDTPVDNEDQNLLPNILLFLLTSLWDSRMDWFFGVDMAIYHTTGISSRVPVVPDAFLSLGVERKKGGKSRRSYATWEENDVVPIWVLEMVSHKPGGEYDTKLSIYQNLGVRYYLIYNPEFWRRDGHQPFELYKLIDNMYQLQIGEPYWMEEVQLGIGRSQQMMGGIEQEILTWFDRDDRALVMPDITVRELRVQLRELRLQFSDQQAALKDALELAEVERQAKEMERQAKEVERQAKEVERQAKEVERQAKEVERQAKEVAQQKADRLVAYLRSQGIDPDRLPE